jgi:hypothetical protein
MEVASTSTKKAFGNDVATVNYADGVAGYPLPQLRAEDNPSLDAAFIDVLNFIVEVCLIPNPEERPSAEHLYELMTEEQIKFNDGHKTTQ